MQTALFWRPFCFASLIALWLPQGWAESVLDYPPLYRELGLPEYPTATVTNLGRANGSLADGLSITLETAASHSELRAFYESRLEALGWTLQESIGMQRMRAAGMLEAVPFSGVFCKADDTGYTMHALDRASYREVKLSVVAASASCSQP